MYEKILLSSFVCFFLFLTLSFSQNHTYNTKTDTILIQSGFLGNNYAMHGKKMNLQVLKWFMVDYPLAHKEIQSAAFSDQLSVFGYTVGGLLFFSGFFLYEENRPLASNLLEFGTYGIGGGLLFQFIAGRYEKKAVRIYNQEIKKLSTSHVWSFKMENDRIVMRLEF